MMTINEMLSPLGDAFRKLYGTTDKYSAADMAKLLSGLENRNLLDDGQYYDTSKGDHGTMKDLTGITIDKANQLLVNSPVIMSCDVEWSNFVHDNSTQNRFGFEYGFTLQTGEEKYAGVWCYPDAKEGSTHIISRFPKLGTSVTTISESFLYNMANTDINLKITNPKMYLDPLGG